MNCEDEIKNIVKSYLYTPITQESLDTLRNELNEKLHEFYQNKYIDNDLVANVELNKDGKVEIWFSVNSIKFEIELEGDTMKYKNYTIEELMKNNFLDDMEFGYGVYEGQAKSARHLVKDMLGADTVALMSDDEIDEYFRREGLVPMKVSTGSGCDNDVVYLVPIEALDKFMKLRR